MQTYDRDETLAANLAYFREHAARYEAEEPHFRAENRARVCDVLARITAYRDGLTLVDLGTGTGFIPEVAGRLFDTVHGVDASPDMIARAEAKSIDCQWHLAPVDATGLPDACADVVTAYAVLHHLADPAAALREAYRLLKPGGVFWSGLDPNAAWMYKFWSLASTGNSTIDREAAKAYAQFTIDAKVEPFGGVGLSVHDLSEMAKRVGFDSVEIGYHWFLGQAEYSDRVYLRGIDDADAHPRRASFVAEYLQRFLPVTAHLFKYIELKAVKR